MPPVFSWRSPEGHALCRRILRASALKYDPHDYQIEGVCASLDGVDLLAITPTGSGKTGFYTMYMLVILAILKDPQLSPSSNFPQDPCLIIICPTIPLQLEMKMRGVNLSALAINSETCYEALTANDEDLWVTARKDINVIIAGPEQLKSDNFEKALRDDHFYNRSCGTGFDELHLLNVWGPSFRQDFHQMGPVKARMSERHNPWILTSATLRDGAPYNNVVQLLGLIPGQFHIIRRSNLRPDVQILFRELSSPLTGGAFPELDWILTQRRSTVIFPKSLTLASALYIYLASKCTPHERSTRIRMYNSMNFPSHNTATRDMINEPNVNAACQIVIGTDSLSVGVDMAARQDAILIGEIADSDEMFQKGGRVGRHRNLVNDARVIVYVTKATRAAAEKALNPPETAKAVVPPPDLSMAEMIVAKCKVEAQNRLYNNPSRDIPCKCLSCTDNPPPQPRDECNCSGCIPESIIPIPKPPSAPKPSAAIPKAKRLTKLQKAHGTLRLEEFRMEIWRQADIAERSFLPPEVFLPAHVIKHILDVYITLDSSEALNEVVQKSKHLTDHQAQLLDFLLQLKPEFKRIADNRKAELAAGKAAKKTAASKPDNSDEASDSEDSGITSEDDDDSAPPTGTKSSAPR
ncbi:hypothetical protein C8R45DRAFT_816808 [Mycena sanguinolenta]|nr:hypothetical protein C8R45DRAFT_816808 [Mycena sanguinolenta]